GRLGGWRARPPGAGAGAERTEASESYRGGATRSGRSHGYSSASRSDDVIDVEVHERKDP
ncbi:MAG: hypothetical protein ACO3S9_08395, partial [Burkholderiaceae bacterium]